MGAIRRISVDAPLVPRDYVYVAWIDVENQELFRERLVPRREAARTLAELFLDVMCDSGPRPQCVWVESAHLAAEIRDALRAVEEEPMQIEGALPGDIGATFEALCGSAIAAMSELASATALRAGDRIVELEVELEGVQPRVWRRLHVSADLTLELLQVALRAAFNWACEHLWLFRGDERRAGCTLRERRAREPDDIEVSVGELLPRKGSLVEYDYYDGFGKSWAHRVRSLGTTRAIGGEPPVACLAGDNRPPPRDSIAFDLAVTDAILRARVSRLMVERAIERAEQDDLDSDIPGAEHGEPTPGARPIWLH